MKNTIITVNNYFEFLTKIENTKYLAIFDKQKYTVCGTSVDCKCFIADVEIQKNCAKILKRRETLKISKEDILNFDKTRKILFPIDKFGMSTDFKIWNPIDNALCFETQDTRSNLVCDFIMYKTSEGVFIQMLSKAVANEFNYMFTKQFDIGEIVYQFTECDLVSAKNYSKF